MILDQVLTARGDEVAPEMSESQFFLKSFRLSKSLRAVTSPGMICKERLGSGGDGGIDSAFLFVNGVLIHEDTDLTVFGSKVEIELIVIQSKRSKGFSESTIQKLRRPLMIF